MVSSSTLENTQPEWARATRFNTDAASAHDHGRRRLKYGEALKEQGLRHRRPSSPFFKYGLDAHGKYIGTTLHTVTSSPPDASGGASGSRKVSYATALVVPDACWRSGRPMLQGRPAYGAPQDKRACRCEV